MLLETQNISKDFWINGKKIQALDGVSIRIPEKGKIGLFGESGSGKTTLGQIIAGLQRPASGIIKVNSAEVSYPFPKTVRKKIQILFQQPEASFNPRRTLWTSMREPFVINHQPVNRRILAEYIAGYGLYPEHLDRYPRELSGGELQRAALARIMVLQPELIVLDEPTSMLDALSQAKLIHMLEDIQKTRKISYLFISHDLALAEYFCNVLYKIDKGKILKEEKIG